MTEAIKIEDLRIGSVVELGRVELISVRGASAEGVCSANGRLVGFSTSLITRIISTPETDAEKIARLERERDEARVQFKEALERFGDDVSSLRGELAEAVGIRDELSERVDILERRLLAAFGTVDPPEGATKTSAPEPQWSKPIYGPPPNGLPGGSYQVLDRYNWDDRTQPSHWLLGDYKAHRIRMHHPITWEGGECPVPGDWVVKVTLRDGVVMELPAARFYWHHHNTGEGIVFRTLTSEEIVSFTLTSDGGE